MDGQTNGDDVRLRGLRRSARILQIHEAHAVKVTVLVTNLGGDSYEGDGEWGYSALVEVDGHKILSAVVSAVGSSFTLGQGIDPRRLAQ